MLFSSAVEEFKAHQRSLEKSATTLKGYAQDLDQFRRWLEATFNCQTYVEDVTISDVEEYLRMLKEERGLTPASRKRVAASIKVFFRYAYRRKWCREDIAAQVQPIKVPQKEREYLTEDEVMEFAGEIRHRLVRVAVLTMYYTGLRVSELADLRKDDVDFENGVVRVVRGKGGKARSVPMSAKLRELLTDYLTWRVDSDYFFATRKSGRLSKEHIDRVIRETRRRLGLRKKVTAHTFRHSFASGLVAKNVNIVNISKLLGHADIKTTSVYTHTDTTQLQDAVNVL